MPEIIHSVQTLSKAIAITFDDGPDPVYTRQMTDIFKAVSGRATFFAMGSRIEEHPDIVREMHEEGHEFGNHTYSHPNLADIGREEAIRELERTDQLIEQCTGRRPAVFRPPYLSYNEEVLQLAEDRGYRTIGALNVETRDWEQPGVDFIMDKTRSHIKNGSILLFHDGTPNDRSQSVEAVRILVAELDSQGYELVTVSELLSRIQQ